MKPSPLPLVADDELPTMMSLLLLQDNADRYVTSMLQVETTVMRRCRHRSIFFSWRNAEYSDRYALLSLHVGTREE